MYRKNGFLLIVLLINCFISGAQEIGANYNHELQSIDLEYAKKTGLEWISVTPNIFEYIRREKNVETEPGLEKVIAAAKAGYKITFGFSWDFKKYNLSIPDSASAQEQEYFAVVLRMLERVGPYIKILNLGYDRNIETKEDILVRFTERLLTEASNWYNNHPEFKRPDMYIGAGVRGLIQMAQDDERVKGLAINLHVSDSVEIQENLRFVRSIMPEKPIIVPDFSLWPLLGQHMQDSIGDSKAGKEFAKKYNYSTGMTLTEWFTKGSAQVGATEWNDLFATRAWFPQHFMLTWFRHFQKFGVVLATYADSWRMTRPLWYDDFVSIVKAGKVQKPNIILIYVDDLGYGDISSYGAKAVKTNNVDRLAKNGLRFTDAHCTAATCTPSRLSLMTGRYAFRSNAAILPGDAPLLIQPGTKTLPSVLQKAGYKTSIVGKWHLGLGNGVIEWNGTIAPGPQETGFDHSFIIPATTDRVPTVFVENGRVPNLRPNDPIVISYGNKIGFEPDGLSNPELLKMKADTQHSNIIINGISRIGFMTGGRSARWVDEDIADVLTGKAKTFIEENKDNPFFLFFSIPDIHVPRAPHRRFVGSTRMGRRGDVITEMDWMTGEIIDQIEKLGLKEKTLIIFSSDNGPVLDDGYADEAVEKLGNHDPSGGFRGGKYSAFEAGTRVPFITYWPGTIKPGVSQALFSQVDLLASIASLTGQPVADTLDSQNMLPALLGNSVKAREYLLEESYTLSLRTPQWKYISPVEMPAPVWFANKKIESGLMQEEQLYDLKKDPGEKKNLAKKNPAVVAELKEQLKKIKR